MQIVQTLRTCRKCRERKSLDAFYETSVGIRANICRACADKATANQRATRQRSSDKRPKRILLGTISKAEWIALCAAYKNRCLACGERCGLTVDHVVPVSKGGRNDLANIQPLCFRCNVSKKDRTVDYRDPEITRRMLWHFAGLDV